MSIEIQNYFYPALPINGVNLSSQWADFRRNFGFISTLIRSSYADLGNNDADNDLAFTAYGELDLSKRFRVGYDKDQDSFVIQFNSGTQATPVWTDYFRIRQSDGQVQAVGSGGLISTNGFYNINLNPLTVKETASGNATFSNVSALTFNTQSGFYLTTDSQGKPVVNFADTAASVGESNTASNVGTGIGIFKQKSGVDLQFKSLLAGANITLTSGTNDVTITAKSPNEGFYGVSVKLTNNAKKFKSINTINFEAANFYLDQNTPNTDEVTIAFRGTAEANTASNVGTGTGVFKQKSGVDLQFKTLLAGSNITLTPGTNDITIASTASGNSGNGFYGVIFKESRTGGRTEIDDTLIFDSSAGFYLTQAGNDSKPLLSFRDYVGTLTSRTIGTTSLISSDVATGSSHDVVLKRLSTGRNIAFYLSVNEITVHTTDSLIVGPNSTSSNLALYPVDNPDTGICFIEDSLERIQFFAGGGSVCAQALSNGYFFANKLNINLPSSSAATPGMSANSDPDTGIHFPGNNNLELVTGGVTRVIISQAPTNYNLDVRGPARIEDKIVAAGFYLEGQGELPKKKSQSFNSSLEWQFNHNLNTRDLIWSTYDTGFKAIVPRDVYVGNPNTAFFYWTLVQAGKAVIIG